MTWGIEEEVARAVTSAQDCPSSQLGHCAIQRPNSGGRPKLLTSHSQEERREGARGSIILLEDMSPMTYLKAFL